MEKSLLTAWVGLWIGWDRVSGDLQGEANIISQVDGVSDMAPTCRLCGSVVGRVQKRDSGPCLPFCLGERRKLSPSSCHNARHFSSFLYATDAFQLLPWCWSSERVSQSKSVHKFPKRNCMGLQKFLPLIQSPLVFAARRYGDLCS